MFDRSTKEKKRFIGVAQRKTLVEMPDFPRPKANERVLALEKRIQEIEARLKELERLRTF